MVGPTALFSKPLHHPLLDLAIVFVLWKSLLLIVAVLSPGPGYDTSTTLIQHMTAAENGDGLAGISRLVSHKLTRWDAIYFTKVANRGYVYEQEWAWGLGWTSLVAFVARGMAQQTSFNRHITC